MSNVLARGNSRLFDLVDGPSSPSASTTGCRKVVVVGVIAVLKVLERPSVPLLDGRSGASPAVLVLVFAVRPVGSPELISSILRLVVRCRTCWTRISTIFSSVRIRSSFFLGTSGWTLPRRLFLGSADVVDISVKFSPATGIMVAKSSTVGSISTRLSTTVGSMSVRFSTVGNMVVVV